MKKVLAVLAACCITASLAFSMGGSEGGNKNATVKMQSMLMQQRTQLHTRKVL